MIYIILFVYTVSVAYLIKHSNTYKDCIIDKSVSEQTKRHSLLRINKSSVRLLVALVIAYAPLIILHAGRYGFGTDYTGTYKNIFYSVQYNYDSVLSSFVEKGYVLLNKIVWNFTDDYVWVIFCASIVTYILLIHSIYKNSETVVASTAMIFLSGYFLDSTTMVRQIIAITTYMVAVKFIYKRKIIPFIIVIVLASFFHRSVLILLPMYFVYGRRWKKKTMIIVLGVSLVAAPTIYNLVLQIMSLIPKYAAYIPAMKRESHFEMMFLLVAVVVFVCMIFNDDGSEKYSFWLFHVTIALIITALSGMIPFLFRFLDYFLVTSIILYVPKCMSNIKSRNRRWIFNGGLYTFLAVYQAYVLYIANWYKAIPYKSIWNR